MTPPLGSTTLPVTFTALAGVGGGVCCGAWARPKTVLHSNSASNVSKLSLRMRSPPRIITSSLIPADSGRFGIYKFEYGATSGVVTNSEYYRCDLFPAGSRFRAVFLCQLIGRHL